MKLPYLEAGEIVSTHGVRGEMKLLPWVDSPEFMLDYHRVRIDGTDYIVESCRVQKTCNLLKLKGIETVEAAQLMRGRIVELYREDVPGELIFAAELLDMDVLDQGKLIGKITEVLDYPGNKVYVVKGEHTYMIPAVKVFVKSMDLDKNEMHVNLIEGMRTDES